MDYELWGGNIAHWSLFIGVRRIVIASGEERAVKQSSTKFDV
jgi:hypothetical protein